MSAPTVVGLSIPADESEPVAVVALEPSLAGIRQYVGEHGTEPYLEAIALGARADGGALAHMWVDEDGRALAHAPNRRASVLAAGRVLGGGAIVGDVLVLGSTPEGDEASLTVDALAMLTRALGVEVMAK